MERVSDVGHRVGRALGWHSWLSLDKVAGRRCVRVVCSCGGIVAQAIAPAPFVTCLNNHAEGCSVASIVDDAARHASECEGDAPVELVDYRAYGERP